MEIRCRAIPQQFTVLLKFMERHGDLSRPRLGVRGRMKAEFLWKELTKSLNSICGGVTKPVDKWKKVWADWKTKTKKKALVQRKNCGSNGGKQKLTVAEKRLLGVMGLTAALGLIENEVIVDETLPQGDSPPQTEEEIVETESPSENKVMLGLFAGDYVVASDSNHGSEASNISLPQEVMAPTSPMPTARQFAQSPVTITVRSAPQNPRHATPRAVSPTVPSPRRQRLSRPRMHNRRLRIPFERATSEFLIVENRRLKFEEDRERNKHQRQMERLRLKSRKIEMEEKRNHTLNRLAEVLSDLMEILPQLRT